MCTTSLQCALTMGSYAWWNTVCPSCLMLCYCGMGAGQGGKEKQKAWHGSPAGPIGCWSVLAFFWKDRSFLLVMLLLQNFFTIYIIPACEGICLFWQCGIFFLVHLWFTKELYDYFFFFFFLPPRLDTYIGKCQVCIKHCQISEVSSSNNIWDMKSHYRPL